MYGTNCGNCKFFTGRTVHNSHLDLNEQGGITPDDWGIENAKKADLVTLPGKERPTAGAICMHPKVAQAVNNRMCCAYWDNSEALRAWKKGKEGYDFKER